MPKLGENVGKMSRIPAIRTQSSTAIPSPNPTPQLSRVVDTSRVGRTKEPAHLPFHRRLLFPTLPIDQPLPAIIQTSKRPELEILNDRLYHLIALILRAYVQSWYPRFSRDRTLLPTLSSRIIIPVLSPILTGIHNDPDRIIHFILLDLPSILTLHWSTYWQARQSQLMAPHLFPPATDIPIPNADPLQGIDKIYHSRLPVLSVYPSPTPQTQPLAPDTPYRRPIPMGQYTLSPLYLTSLADALLRLHLPVAEYACTAERIMAREIVGRVVLGAVCTKLGEGWFWWNLGLKLMVDSPSVRPDSKKNPEGSPKEGPAKILDTAFALFWKVYHTLLLLWSFVISVSARYTASPPTEERYKDCAGPWMALGREVLGVDGRPGVSPKRWGLRLAWGVLEVIISLMSPLIDRILPHLIRSTLTPSLSLRLVDLAERLLFPLDGYPAPSPPDLTPEEAAAVREAFEVRLQEIIPRHLQNIFFPHPSDISAVLDPLDNPGCNAHLIAMLLDSIVGVLEPGLVVPLSPDPVIQ